MQYLSQTISFHITIDKSKADWSAAIFVVILVNPSLGFNSNTFFHALTLIWRKKRGKHKKNCKGTSGLSLSQRERLKEHLSLLFWWINLNIRLLLLLPSVCLSFQILKIAKARFAIWRNYSRKNGWRRPNIKSSVASQTVLHATRKLHNDLAYSLTVCKNDRAHEWLVLKLCG